MAKARKAPAPPVKTGREVPLMIRLTTEEKRMFTEAADREHLSLSAWVRLAAVHAARADHGIK